jgi:S-DNA-T family DNA segregation ATPase FtsK/SpoIIIE
MDDELISRAIEIAKENQDGICVNLLQRTLRIGAFKSSKLIEELEMRGIIGSYDPSENIRRVLVK